MKKLARLALVVTLLVAYFPPSRFAAAKVPKVSPETWFNGAAGYARAVELQKELNLPLVVYFYTDRCPYCQTLDNKYLPSTPVKNYLRGVLKVRINPKQGRAELALSKRYGIKDYPSFFVVRYPATRPVNVHPFRKAGDLTPKEFAKACRAAAAPAVQKEAVVRSSGVSGKFRERSEVVTTVSTTKGGAQVVTVVPVPTPSPRVRSPKAQP